MLKSLSYSCAKLWCVACCLIALFAASAHAQTATSDQITVTVADNQFGVTAPAEQCLYEEFSTLNGDPAMLFFGACSRAKPSGLFTLSIGADTQHQTVSQLKTFFQSSKGKAALAQSKAPDGVEIKEVRQRNGILFMQLADKSGPLVPLTESTVWRAMFQQSEHFISIAYLPLATQQMASDQAFDRLHSFAVKFKRQNIRWIPAGLKKSLAEQK